VSDTAAGHTPVLLPQVVAALNIRASGTYLDATFGRGGHAGAILQNLIANGRLLCLDRDPAAIAEANGCIVVTDNEKDFADIEIVNPLR